MRKLGIEADGEGRERAFDGYESLGDTCVVRGLFFPKVFFTKLHPSSHPPPKLANARGGGGNFLLSQKEERGNLCGVTSPRNLPNTSTI